VTRHVPPAKTRTSGPQAGQPCHQTNYPPHHSETKTDNSRRVANKTPTHADPPYATHAHPALSRTPSLLPLPENNRPPRSPSTSGHRNANQPSSRLQLHPPNRPRLAARLTQAATPVGAERALIWPKAPDQATRARTMPNRKSAELHRPGSPPPKSLPARPTARQTPDRCRPHLPHTMPGSQAISRRGRVSGSAPASASLVTRTATARTQPQLPRSELTGLTRQPGAAPPDHGTRKPAQAGPGLRSSRVRER